MKRITAMLAAVVMLAGACGRDEGPKQTLVDAVEQLVDAPGLTYTITVRSDVGSLRAMFAAGSGEGPSEEVAQTILDSSLILSSNNETDPSKMRASYALSIGARENVVEWRVVGTDLYARADVPRLFEMFGQNAAAAERLAAQGEAAGFTFARAAVDGRWLAVKDLDKFAEQITGRSFEKQSSTQYEALDRLAEDLEKKARVTAGDVEGPGEHLIVTISTRDAYESVVDFAKSAAQMLPAQSFPPASEIPDEDLRIDAWVEDGFLRQVEFDFTQPGIANVAGEGLPEGVDELAFRITLDEFTGEIVAPDDATEIDLQQIFGMLMGGGMGGGSGSGPPSAPGGDFCKQLKGAPPEVLKQFEDECPELQSG